MKRIIFIMMMLPFYLFAEDVATLKISPPSQWKKPFAAIELYIHPKNKDITLVIQKFNYKKNLFLTKDKITLYLKEQEQVRSIANATIQIKNWTILKNEFDEHQFPRFQKLSINGVFRDHNKEVKFKEIEYFLGKQSVQVNLSYPSNSNFTQADIERILSQTVVVK